MAAEASQQQVRSLIERIAQKLTKLDEITDAEPSDVLGPPASPDEIVNLERVIGTVLPDDYKEFLLLHNGWKDFSGESSLLSTREMANSPIHDHVISLQAELRSQGLENVAGGLVFEASFGNRLSYFDRATRAAGGNLDVVYWDNRELGRFASFTEYLQDYESTLDQLISEESENLR